MVDHRRIIRVARRALVLAPLMLAVMAGCAGAPRPTVETALVPYTQEQKLARELARDARYRLRPGDRLNVAFKFEPQLNADNLLVLPDGYVALKGLAAPVLAAGRTVEELDQVLLEAYAADYRNPDLSVMVGDITAPEVYVLGAVKQPGLYKLPERGRGVIQAVALAGGYLEDAEQGQTVLLRAADDGFVVRRFDLSDLADLGMSEVVMMDLEPYDIVYVPRTRLSDLARVTQHVFGSVVKVTSFFWDVYALSHMNKIQTIMR